MDGLCVKSTQISFLPLSSLNPVSRARGLGEEKESVARSLLVLCAV